MTAEIQSAGSSASATAKLWSIGRFGLDDDANGGDGDAEGVDLMMALVSLVVEDVEPGCMAVITVTDQTTVWTT